MTQSNSELGLHEALNLLLADSFALYIKTKNFHWHVSGPQFRDYHLLFDSQAGELLAMTDVIAERVRKTGGTTLRSIGQIARLQRIADSDKVSPGAVEMIEELFRDNRALAEAVREVKRVADAAGDFATSALADGWLDGAEGRAWFLGESLAA